MDRTTTDFYDLATREFDRRVRGVGPDDWDQPTPCTDWDVRALVNHVVNEMLWVPPLMEGSTITEVGDRFDGDLLGDEPARRWSEAAEAASSTVHADGALSRTVHLSFGDLVADEYVWQLIADLTIHAWDLARGSGGEEQIDSALVDAVTARFEPQKEMIAASGVFGTPVEVPDDADPQTKMLAVVGRRA